MLRERPASYMVIRTLVEILGSWIDGSQSLHERKHSVELLSLGLPLCQEAEKKNVKEKVVERRLNQCYLQLYFFSPIPQLIFLFPP